MTAAGELYLEETLVYVVVSGTRKRYTKTPGRVTVKSYRVPRGELCQLVYFLDFSKKLAWRAQVAVCLFVRARAHCVVCVRSGCLHRCICVYDCVLYYIYRVCRCARLQTTICTPDVDEFGGDDEWNNLTCNLDVDKEMLLARSKQSSLP